MDLPFLGFDYDFQLGYDKYPFATILHLTMNVIRERDFCISWSWSVH